MGVTMVQQNRTQFMMAENAQSQTTNFSDADNILKSAENYIAGARYEVWPFDFSGDAGLDCNTEHCSAYNCQTPGGVFQQLMPGDLQGGAVLDGPLPGANGSNVEIVKTVCIWDKPVGLQYEDCSSPDPKICAAGEGSNQCHTELYTIRATMLDEAYNERVIESNYAVRCDN